MSRPANKPPAGSPPISVVQRHKSFNLSLFFTSSAMNIFRPLFFNFAFRKNQSFTNVPISLPGV